MAERDPRGQHAQPPRQRESAEERRERQTAAALAKQVDLKREAAERRDRKDSPDDDESSG